MCLMASAYEYINTKVQIDRARHDEIYWNKI